ncbi:MAG: ribosome maturation factor RimM, partial [Oscillospiraceae bacterium]
MEYLETGEIVSVHGIKGEVKVYPWADYPEFLEDFDEFYIKNSKQQYQKLIAQEIRCHKNMVLVKFEGIDTVEIARTLIGKIAYIDKGLVELEEGRYFVADLIGCTVINAETQEIIGVVEDVDNFGASDIYTVKTSEGKSYLFPAVKDF